MREVVLDTETTGLDPEAGNRIVEIGAVELSGHIPTGETYHQYINPQRDMPQEAFAVHGLSNDFLRDKPVFKDVAQALVDFIGSATLVIHNAAFDMKFLNSELRWIGRPTLANQRVIDTLEIARQRFPGAPASLDALCRRFGVDNSNRSLHGALLDSEILAAVYLQLIGGRQPDLELSPHTATHAGSMQAGPGPRIAPPPTTRLRPLAPRLSPAEKDAHACFIKTLAGDSLWTD